MAKKAQKAGNGASDIKVVSVESRLSKLALQPGGITKEAAVAKAGSAIDSLRTDYPDWLEEDLASLQEAILVANQDGGQDRAALDAIYRKAAQIRDLGTSFDFPLITAAADSLCELIYRLVENQAYDPKSIDCHVTALKYLKQPKSQTAEDKQSLPLVRGLRALAERYERPKPPEPQKEHLEVGKNNDVKDNTE